MSVIHKNAPAHLFKGGWLLAVIFLASCAAGQIKKSIIMNMNYHEARKIILQSGWKPADDLRPYEEIGFTADHFRDLGYTEVDDCAGDGLSACVFYFQNDKGEFLKIGTEGEDNGLLMYPRVVYAAIRDKID